MEASSTRWTAICVDRDCCIGVGSVTNRCPLVNAGSNASVTLSGQYDSCAARAQQADCPKRDIPVIRGFRIATCRCRSRRFARLHFRADIDEPIHDFRMISIVTVVPGVNDNCHACQWRLSNLACGRQVGFPAGVGSKRLVRSVSTSATANKYASAEVYRRGAQ